MEAHNIRKYLMATSGLDKIVLSAQEKQWILDQRVTRLTDNQEVLIYPMGAERYLSSALQGHYPQRYPIIDDIKGKDLLVVPGYGISGFLFAQAGAKSVAAYDKDPVTIAYLKAIKKYYHYRQINKQGYSYPSVGDLLNSLTRWYPPLLKLPQGMFINTVHFLLFPKSLRVTYLQYLLSLLREAIQLNADNQFELEYDIKFHAQEINAASGLKFDTAFVPYLLGVTNGIEQSTKIISFIKELLILVPQGHIIVSPSRSTKEFYVLGKSYFSTSGFARLTDIQALKDYCIDEDLDWFKTQGLVVFGNKTSL